MFTHVVDSFTILLGGLFLTQSAVFIGSVMFSSIVLFLQYHSPFFFLSEFSLKRNFSFKSRTSLNFSENCTAPSIYCL